MSEIFKNIFVGFLALAVLLAIGAASVWALDNAPYVVATIAILVTAWVIGGLLRSAG